MYDRGFSCSDIKITEEDEEFFFRETDIGREIEESKDISCPRHFLAQHHHKIDTDKILMSLNNDNFLLFTDSREGEIYKMNLSTYISEPLFGFHPNPIAVSFDKEKERIYWSDNELRQLKSGDIEGKTNRVVRFLGNDSVVDGISIDSVSRLLFFTDSGYSTISVVTLDGNNYQKTIIQEAVDKPRAIVSDYETGVIYWTDWGDSPRIERANYDGSERQDLITRGLYWPNGLAIDFEGIHFALSMI
ncbi:low-density lipoprotein receptor-related protein 4-like [Saccostrea echinata]|uniref:low-density lipoprotein receptor-related protein 4-like n=1 Tax=Saccostrea echinata TaxID=191078 RepID=UPI002A7F32F3|nr:low-density lipoprotein receptor-related protein 4-like [Saccostrea echinata]